MSLIVNGTNVETIYCNGTEVITAYAIDTVHNRRRLIFGTEAITTITFDTLPAGKAYVLTGAVSDEIIHETTKEYHIGVGSEITISVSDGEYIGTIIGSSTDKSYSVSHAVGTSTKSGTVRIGSASMTGGQLELNWNIGNIVATIMLHGYSGSDYQQGSWLTKVYRDGNSYAGLVLSGDHSIQMTGSGSKPNGWFNAGAYIAVNTSNTYRQNYYITGISYTNEFGTFTGPNVSSYISVTDNGGTQYTYITVSVPNVPGYIYTLEEI